MQKDIDKIEKNPETDIIIRMDDFGGKRGITIREFVHSERYTGFTKAGTRISADKFAQFKAAINSVDESELAAEADQPTEEERAAFQKKLQSKGNFSQGRSSSQGQGGYSHGQQRFSDNHSQKPKPNAGASGVDEIDFDDAAM